MGIQFISFPMEVPGQLGPRSCELLRVPDDAGADGGLPAGLPAGRAAPPGDRLVEPRAPTGALAVRLPRKTALRRRSAGTDSGRLYSARYGSVDGSAAAAAGRPGAAYAGGERPPGVDPGRALRRGAGDRLRLRAQPAPLPGGRRAGARRRAVRPGLAAGPAADGARARRRSSGWGWTAPGSRCRTRRWTASSPPSPCAPSPTSAAALARSGGCCGRAAGCTSSSTAGRPRSPYAAGSAGCSRCRAGWSAAAGWTAGSTGWSPGPGWRSSS